MAPRRLRHTAVLGSRLLGHAHRTPSGEARNSAGTCGTSRCEPMGGLAWRERAAVDDTRVSDPTALRQPEPDDIDAGRRRNHPGTRPGPTHLVVDGTR